MTYDLHGTWESKTGHHTAMGPEGDKLTLPFAIWYWMNNRDTWEKPGIRKGMPSQQDRPRFRDIRTRIWLSKPRQQWPRSWKRLYVYTQGEVQPVLKGSWRTSRFALWVLPWWKTTQQKPHMAIKERTG